MRRARGDALRYIEVPEAAQPRIGGCRRRASGRKREGGAAARTLPAGGEDLSQRCQEGGLCPEGSGRSGTRSRQEAGGTAHYGRYGRRSAARPCHRDQGQGRRQDSRRTGGSRFGGHENGELDYIGLRRCGQADPRLGGRCRTGRQHIDRGRERQELVCGSRTACSRYGQDRRSSAARPRHRDQGQGRRQGGHGPGDHHPRSHENGELDYIGLRRLCQADIRRRGRFGTGRCRTGRDRRLYGRGYGGCCRRHQARGADRQDRHGTAARPRHRDQGQGRRRG